MPTPTSAPPDTPPASPTKAQALEPLPYTVSADDGAITFPHKPNSPTSIILISSWLGAIGVLTCLGFSIILVPSKTYRTVATVTLGLLTVAPLPKVTNKNPLDRAGFYIGKHILNHACTYFGLTVRKNKTPLPKDHDGKGLIIALEPHDILPFSIFAFAWHVDLFPEFKRRGYGLMTSSVFQLPYVRQIYSYCCGGSIDKKNFVEKLTNDEMIVMIPGGVQEVIEQKTRNTNDFVLYLNKRKGFIKLALIHGSIIIPSFTFGYDGSYDTWIPDPADKLQLNKKLGFLPMLYFGRLWGFAKNLLPLGIPSPVKLTVCTGKPIVVKVTPDPTQEQIEELHKKFVDGILKVYEENKVKMGCADRKIVVI